MQIIFEENQEEGNNENMSREASRIFQRTLGTWGMWREDAGGAKESLRALDLPDSQGFPAWGYVLIG